MPAKCRAASAPPESPPSFWSVCASAASPSPRSFSRKSSPSTCKTGLLGWPPGLSVIMRLKVEREQVLARLRERIVRYAACHLSRDAAEDLAQEVLLLLHEKYAHLERVEDLLPL